MVPTLKEVSRKIKCDHILENHTSGHKQNLWENSVENFRDYFKIYPFAHSDEANTVKFHTHSFFY